MAPTNPSLTRHNGTLIRTLRIKAGKKAATFAREVSCTPRHLYDIENERGEMSRELLHRIAGVLGVPATALVRDPADALHPADRIAS